MAIKLFLTGGTGYVGGSVLNALLLAENRKEFEVRALVRTEEKASILRPLGVIPVIGSLKDTHILEDEASKSDVVIQVADADDEVAATTLIRGLEKRYHEYGKRPIFIHTSGTGVLLDRAGGESSIDKIYHDNSNAEMNSLDKSQPHRFVDLIVQGSSELIDTIIISPPTIWGYGTGLDAKHSNQIPWMIRAAIKNKRAYHVGKGLNVWNQIHVEDLADFYVFLLQLALQGKAKVGSDGYYFCEGGEFRFIEVSAVIAKTLKKLGVSDSDTASDCPKDECYKIFGDLNRGFEASFVLGGNSRSRAVKGREFGWSPKRSGHDQFAKYIEEEVEMLLNEKK